MIEFGVMRDLRKKELFQRAGDAVGSDFRRTKGGGEEGGVIVGRARHSVRAADRRRACGGQRTRLSQDLVFGRTSYKNP